VRDERCDTITGLANLVLHAAMAPEQQHGRVAHICFLSAESSSGNMPMPSLVALALDRS